MDCAKGVYIAAIKCTFLYERTIRTISQSFSQSASQSFHRSSVYRFSPNSKSATYTLDYLSISNQQSSLDVHLKNILRTEPRGTKIILTWKSITTRIMTVCPNHNCKFNNMTPEVKETEHEDGSVSTETRNQHCARCGRELSVTVESAHSTCPANPVTTRVLGSLGMETQREN